MHADPSAVRQDYFFCLICISTAYSDELWTGEKLSQ